MGPCLMNGMGMCTVLWVWYLMARKPYLGFPRCYCLIVPILHGAEELRSK